MNKLGRALTEFTDPPVTVLFVYNCNPLTTVPDQNRVRTGLMREDLFTVVHEQVMTDTAQYADLVLPATTFLEHYDIAKGYGAYHLHLVQPAIDAVGEARPNPEVFRDLGMRLGLSEPGDELGEAGALMDAAARLPGPHGQAVLEGRLGVAPGDGRPIQFVDVMPKTADGRAHLYPSRTRHDGRALHVSTRPRDRALPAQPDLTGQRTHDLVNAWRAPPGIASLRLHPDDAHARSIGEGDSVRIYNDLGQVDCTASVTPEIRPGTVSLAKGLWARSTFNGATANALVPDSLTDLAGGACFNDARVQVELLGRH